MAFKVRSSKMSFYEEPELLLKTLRQIYSQIGLQKMKGCLSCLVLPMLGLGCFFGFVVIFVGSREPDSVFGRFLSDLGVLEFLMEPAVQTMLPFGILLLVPVIGGFLWLVNKISGTPIDKNRVGPAISCLEFLAKHQKDRKPVKLELDFRQPDNEKFLLEDDYTQTFRQTWLTLSAELSELTLNLEISQECIKGPDEEVGMSVHSAIETIAVTIESPSHSLSLHNPATIDGLIVETFEASKERATIVYKTEGDFLKFALSGLNCTQVRAEMFPPLLESLLA